MKKQKSALESIPKGRFAAPLPPTKREAKKSIAQVKSVFGKVKKGC